MLERQGETRIGATYKDEYLSSEDWGRTFVGKWEGEIRDAALSIGWTGEMKAATLHVDVLESRKQRSDTSIQGWETEKGKTPFSWGG